MKFNALVPRALRIITVFALGCTAADETRDAASANAHGSTANDSAAISTSAPWYSRARTLDLTGDGVADSVRLEAIGTRLDSLQVALSFLVAGQEKYREEWGSSYELALVDSAAREGPRADALLRARLDSALAGVIVEPLDAPGVRLMAEDRAILADLDPRPAERISFSYGFESTTRLVWDAPRERFVRLWSCC